MNRPEHQYLRFIRLLNGLASKQRIDDVEPTSRRVLEEIAIGHLSDKPLTVTQLLQHRQIASPATMHRKMLSLKNTGLIELNTSASGKRVKHILLTRQGKRYITVLSRLMARAGAG